MSVTLFVIITEICGPERYNLSLSEITNMTSPFYPSTYPENWECVWFITSIDDGFPIFTIIDMKTEETNDILHIGQGYNSTGETTLLELFGDLGESMIKFEIRTLWMQFRTNHRVGARGFIIHMTLQSEYGKYSMSEMRGGFRQVDGVTV